MISGIKMSFVEDCSYTWIVHFQGVPGAYSESAAQKAYPDCEAVPCEQFDTAFEVRFYCLNFAFIT